MYPGGAFYSDGKFDGKRFRAGLQKLFTVSQEKPIDGKNNYKTLNKNNDINNL
jgi:hypothetical protein